MSNNKTEYVSLQTAIADFYEDDNIKQQDVDESLIGKWATHWAEEITTDRQLEPKIAWLSVDNYKAKHPEGVEIILEVAYRTEDPKKSCDIRGYQIVQYAQDTFDGCTLEMNVVCPDCNTTSCDCTTDDVIVDIGTAFEVSHPEMYYEKYLKVGRFGYGASVYDPGWKILCYTDNHWFGLNKHLPGCANIYCRECPHSYRVNPPTIETSFERGEILLSYLGRKMDKNGYIMIPKHRDVFEAVLQHITYKWFRREYLSKRDPSDRAIYQEAKLLRDEATVSAISKLSMPSFEEFSKFWSKNKWSKIDSAYSNMLDGYDPIVTLNERNIYKS